MSDGAEILGFPVKFNSDYPCDVEPKYAPEEMVEMPTRGEQYSLQVKPGLRVHTSIPNQSPAAKILQDAALLIDGERDKQHGNRHECHQQIARLWTAYLGVKVDKVDVACLMALLKIARTQTGSYNRDCFVDGSAYLSLAGELSEIKA